MKALIVVLLLAVVAIQLSTVANATQRAEDGSLVPDSFYAQTDYRPVSLGKAQHFQGKDCGGSWQVAYTELGVFGETVPVDGTDTDAINMQKQMESDGWDNTIIYYLRDSCS